MGIDKEEAINGVKLSLESQSTSTTPIQNNFIPNNTLNDDNTAAVQAVKNMGFSEAYAKYAMNVATQLMNNNTALPILDPNASNIIMNAALYQQQMASNNTSVIDCNGSVKECNHTLRLINALQTYDSTQNNNNLFLMNVLNDFKHVISNHDDDNDFEYIYKACNTCDISKCKIMQRHHKNVNTDNKKDKYQIIDKIHCRFIHSYDIGCRLTSSERIKLQQFADIDIKNNDDNKDEFIHKYHHKQLSEMKKIIKSKSKIYQTYGNIKSLNKFNQIKLSYDHYSFGHKFYYWYYFKNCQDRDVINVGYKYCDWYVEHKYNSFKQELLQNISVSQWELDYDYATKYIKMDYAKTIIADPQYTNSSTVNTSLYGILRGASVTLYHLMSIMVYCNYTELQFKFTETFRRIHQQTSSNNNCNPTTITIFQSMYKKNPNLPESDESLKSRHSNFYYLAKYITETVQIYSTEAIDKKTEIFYHGINKEMLFDSTRCRIQQPLSTTGSYEVAYRFSNKTGMILTLTCFMDERYFDCSWISNFSEENEMLFINCVYPMTFENITNTLLDTDYELYIKAISIIDSFTSTIAYQSDHDLFKWNSKSQKMNLNPSAHNAKPIETILKYVAITLINNELALNNNKPIDLYIKQLFHNICIKKHQVIINAKYIDDDILKSYGAGGYQGYKFLKDILFEKNCKMFRLDLILSLFPNAKIIGIDNLDFVSNRFLDCILKRIPYIKASIGLSITLSLLVSIYDSSTNSLVSSYGRTFLKLGWVINYKPGWISIVKMKDKIDSKFVEFVSNKMFVDHD